MTRFARAKGSKASNERIPEEPTPWFVMKRQLEMAISREEQETPTRTKTAKELIRENEISSKSDANWAEFDAPKSKVNKVKNGRVEKKPKSEKKVKQALEETIIGDSPIQKTTKKEKAVKHENAVESKHSTSDPAVTEKLESAKTKKNKKKKRKISEVNGKEIGDTKEQAGDSKNKNQDGEKLSKRQKRNKKKINSKDEKGNKVSNATFNTEGNDWNNSVDFERENKDKSNGPSNEYRKPWSQLSIEEKNSYRFGKNVPRKFQKKVAKVRDNQKHQRRKPDTESIKVVINGMEVEITKYDGFPIKKDDAERLTALRKEMVLKGIPKSEIDAAMKLERRKCEKALARIRKQVCFHCRKAGHNLSDCPELEKEEVGTGICFKCGSTEHTHFECRVTKADDYRFAKCFICREQGHIAKQCPDNPKGLYPDGGSCKICGDVTHLKKDCPDLAREKEETTITLDTIKDSNIESLENKSEVETSAKKVSKKVVQF